MIFAYVYPWTFFQVKGVSCKEVSFFFRKLVRRKLVEFLTKVVSLRSREFEILFSSGIGS